MSYAALYFGGLQKEVLLLELHRLRLEQFLRIEHL